MATQRPSTKPSIISRSAGPVLAGPYLASESPSISKEKAASPALLTQCLAKTRHQVVIFHSLRQSMRCVIRVNVATPATVVFVCFIFALLSSNEISLYFLHLLQRRAFCAVVISQITYMMFLLVKYQKSEYSTLCWIYLHKNSMLTPLLTSLLWRPLYFEWSQPETLFRIFM